GYAQVNKTGSIRAYQFVSFYGANNGSQDGTKVPTRYLPVGQGFIVEIEDNGVLPFDGTVEFNNSQRVFIKESDADPSNDQVGSVFLKTANDKSTKDNNSKALLNETPMQKIRLEFNSVTGPETRHELLLGFSEYTTDGYDYGYDAKNTVINNNDLNLSLEGVNMNIQAYGEITSDKIVPLNFKSSGDNTFEIRITDTDNLEVGQEIYLLDNLTGNYFDLTENLAYTFSSEQGVFNERFKIVFQSKVQSLSIEEPIMIENYVYYKNETNTLYVKNLDRNISKLSLVNMLGQVVTNMKEVSKERLENGIQFSNISAGSYVVWIRTDSGKVITKKIIVN
uniref:T9SS type A sorting domain-containing protein n=1 Tax=uncultured Algibacter sp. TaxID=298659 RepID=UPI00260266C6